MTNIPNPYVLDAVQAEDQVLEELVLSALELGLLVSVFEVIPAKRTLFRSKVLGSTDLSAILASMEKLVHIELQFASWVMDGAGDFISRCCGRVSVRRGKGRELLHAHGSCTGLATLMEGALEVAFRTRVH